MYVHHSEYMKHFLPHFFRVMVVRVLECYFRDQGKEHCFQLIESCFQLEDGIVSGCSRKVALVGVVF